MNLTETRGVGEGQLNLGVLADWNSNVNAGTVGGYADYSHRITESISAYSRAEAGRVMGAGPDYNFARVGAGIRINF